MSDKVADCVAGVVHCLAEYSCKSGLKCSLEGLIVHTEQLVKANCKDDALKFNEQLTLDLPLMTERHAVVVQLKFSDPKQLADDLHGQGFQAVWMIDPGISATPGYFAYDSGTKEGAWVLKKDGKPFIGKKRRLFPRLLA
jgi:hypothetical protein